MSLAMDPVTLRNFAFVGFDLADDQHFFLIDAKWVLCVFVAVFPYQQSFQISRRLMAT